MRACPVTGAPKRAPRRVAVPRDSIARLRWWPLRCSALWAPSAPRARPNRAPAQPPVTCVLLEVPHRSRVRKPSSAQIPAKPPRARSCTRVLPAAPRPRSALQASIAPAAWRLPSRVRRASSAREKSARLHGLSVLLVPSARSAAVPLRRARAMATGAQLAAARCRIVLLAPSAPLPRTRLRSVRSATRVRCVLLSRCHVTSLASCAQRAASRPLCVRRDMSAPPRARASSARSGRSAPLAQSSARHVRLGSCVPRAVTHLLLVPQATSAPL